MPDIEGTNVGETLVGTGSPEWIAGYDGLDTIYGGGGGDYINGGRGDDYLYGEGGDDVFEIGGFASSSNYLDQAGGLQNGYDSFYGGDGYDQIAILPTSNYAWAAIMIDYMSGVEELDNQGGGPGYVYFRGTVDFSSIVAMVNINAIAGSGSADHFIGGVLGETVAGMAGNDTLDGNGGDDVLVGGQGNDTLSGGTGADEFRVGDDEGWDTYHGGTSTTADTASSDIIRVSSATYSGSDIDINITAWSDISAVVNDSGVDTYLNFAGSFDLSAVSLANILGARGSAGSDTIIGTTSYDSTLAANRGILLEGLAGNDTIIGSSLGDQVDGGAGEDIIFAAAGNDALFGGADEDWFWFEAGDGTDTVYDFADGTDKIVVGSSVSTINLYDYSGSALLQFDDTYVLLSGVSTAAIDGSDLLWA